MCGRGRTAVLGALVSSCGLAAVLVTGLPAQANDLIVKYDQSQLLPLKRPAAQIIVGNPSIVDVEIQHNDFLVVTGKTFGMTNLIVLDADRRIIEERRLFVQRDEYKVVNLQKGNKRELYSCVPQCNPSITIGDDSSYFDTVAKNSERKIKFSDGAASDAGVASGQ